jgi:chemotaxis protein histidine kinase CheA
MKMIKKSQLRETCSLVFSGAMEDMIESIKNSQNQPISEEKPAESSQKREKYPQKKENSPKKKQKTGKKQKKEEKKESPTRKEEKKSAKRDRSQSKNRENPKKRKVSDKKFSKKCTIRNECCLSIENIAKIRDDIEKEVYFVSENGNIDVNNNEPWKNSYYRNYDLGEEIAKSKGGYSGLVEIYFDDRQQHLILSCNYEKGGVNTSFYVLLDDFDNVNGLKVNKDVKNGLVVLLELIKSVGLVRELSQDNSIFGVAGQTILIHEDSGSY